MRAFGGMLGDKRPAAGFDDREYCYEEVRMWECRSEFLA